MTSEKRVSWPTDDSLNHIESKVLAKLGGRLMEFQVAEENGQLVLRGRATSYHVKQLAQHEVMELTATPIRTNRIVVNSPVVTTN